MKKIILLGSLFTLLCISACTNQDEPIVSATPAVTSTPAVTAAPSPTPLEKTISASEKSKIGSQWTKVGGYGYDIDNDGVKENVTLSTSAQTSDGYIMWDDSQQWVLEVSNGIDTFTLFDGIIQNGSAYITISEYYQNDTTVPTISLIKSTGTNFSVTNYEYNSKNKTFTEKIVLNSDDTSTGGINQLYSSIPDIE